ncbi:MAG: COX15/CtaA family protein [Hyphomonadaceae bacterium]
MGGEWLPSTAFGLEPIWRNFTDDHATQHLMHRTLGYVVALAALLLALVGGVAGRGAARLAAVTVGLLALVQAALGVLTVVHASPLSLSLIHQTGAVVLWISAVVTYYSAHKLLK